MARPAFPMDFPLNLQHPQLLHLDHRSGHWGGYLQLRHDRLDCLAANVSPSDHGTEFSMARWFQARLVRCLKAHFSWFVVSTC